MSEISASLFPISAPNQLSAWPSITCLISFARNSTPKFNPLGYEIA
jgi:hypothetical protein